MLGEVWQRLTRLESHDLIRDLFERLHGRALSSSRTSEIRSAARQSREYFRQAITASQAVRPLLTFYGVASLSRALVLLLRRGGGESSLTKGHGLATCDWSGMLTSDIVASLSQVGLLKIRTCGGLFSDLMDDTQNRICIHVRSEAVDWRLEYDVPTSGIELNLGDLLERLPDLKSELNQADIPFRAASIGDMSFTDETGFRAMLSGLAPAGLQSSIEGSGFVVNKEGQNQQITGSVALFNEGIPQFLHAYVRKLFGTIPDLYLVEPLPHDVRLSQIGMTYFVSYGLGMLARYYPTHWMALIDGGKGDRMWPMLRRAQQYAEIVYPELVSEFIDEAIASPLRSSSES